ncbi:MAG: rRNA maturation RNase YbeY [Saprospiraceae bacterium]
MEEQLLSEALVSFHSEDIDFKLEEEASIQQWINVVVEQQKANLIGLSYIFCSDAYLHNINLEYLNHDTLTDIITFPYLTPPDVEGDIFISIERVRENAQTFKVPFEQELRRVIIHGVLHLCGQADKTEAEAAEMRRKEEEALRMFQG